MRRYLRLNILVSLDGATHRHDARINELAAELRALVAERRNERISAAKTGQWASTLTRERMSAAKLGKTQSEATRAKISAANKGKPKGPAHRARIAAAMKALHARP